MTELRNPELKKMDPNLEILFDVRLQVQHVMQKNNMTDHVVLFYFNCIYNYNVTQTETGLVNVQ